MPTGRRGAAPEGGAGANARPSSCRLAWDEGAELPVDRAPEFPPPARVDRARSLLDCGSQPGERVPWSSQEDRRRPEGCADAEAAAAPWLLPPSSLSLFFTAPASFMDDRPAHGTAGGATGDEEDDYWDEEDDIGGCSGKGRGLFLTQADVHPIPMPDGTPVGGSVWAQRSGGFPAAGQYTTLTGESPDSRRRNKAVVKREACDPRSEKGMVGRSERRARISGFMGAAEKDEHVSGTSTSGDEIDDPVTGRNARARQGTGLLCPDCAANGIPKKTRYPHGGKAASTVRVDPRKSDARPAVATSPLPVPPQDVVAVLSPASATDSPAGGVKGRRVARAPSRSQSPSDRIVRSFLLASVDDAMEVEGEQTRPPCPADFEDMVEQQDQDQDDELVQEQEKLQVQDQPELQPEGRAAAASAEMASEVHLQEEVRTRKERSVADDDEDEETEEDTRPLLERVRIRELPERYAKRGGTAAAPSRPADAADGRSAATPYWTRARAAAEKGESQDDVAKQGDSAAASPSLAGNWGATAGGKRRADWDAAQPHQQSAKKRRTFQPAAAAKTTTSKPVPPGQRRPLRNPWTEDEARCLVEAVEAHGPAWAYILSLHGRAGTVSRQLAGRGQVQLKDKARNIKLARIRTGQPLGRFETVSGHCNE